MRLCIFELSPSGQFFVIFSHSLTPDPFFMSYVSILKSLPETRSASLAILASLGIHGLLWVVIPFIPFSSQSIGPASQRTIGLVQLTPAELSRLPRAATPPIQLPAFATQPSTLPPLPPPPEFNSLPQIPNGTTNYKDLLNAPFQPQFQTLAPLSAPFQNKTTPSKPDNQIKLVPFKFDNQLPPPPPPPSSTPPADSRMAYVPIKPAPLPDFLRNSPSPTPTTSGTESNTPTNIAPETAIKTPPTTAPVVLPSTGSRIPQRTIDELLARRAQLGQPSPARDANGSTLVALTEDLRKWFTEVNPTSWKKVALRPSYPQQACPGKLEGNASIVVLVNPQGNIINGPRLNKTTGYDILDRSAVAAVKEYRFKPKNDERRAYLFGVEYKPDKASCASTSQPTPATQNTATPQPTPATQNTATPQPTPATQNTATPQPTPATQNTATPQPTPATQNTATPQPTPENGLEQPKS